MGLILDFGAGEDSLTFFLTRDWRQVLEMSDRTTGLVMELEAILEVRAFSW